MISSSCWDRWAYRVPLLTALILFGGCRQNPENSMQLRIHNESATRIEKLVVQFPEDNVEFGDVGPAAFSVYRSVPHGIGPHASLRFVVNGIPYENLVVDFVGWRPLSGRAFTYRVRLDPGESQPFLNIFEVVKDR